MSLEPKSHSCENLPTDCVQKRNLVEQILDDVKTLSLQQRQQLLEALEAHHECACQPEKFPTDAREPCIEAAVRVYNTALQKTEKNEQQMHKMKLAVRRIVKKMILETIQGRRKKYNGPAQRIADEMAGELVSMKDVKIQDLVETFERRDREMREKCNIQRNPIRQNSEDFERLIELLDARQPVKTYLRKIIIDASDLRELDLMRIWREKVASNGGDSPEAREAKASIDELGKAANVYCSSFFKPHTLHPEIEATHDLDVLGNMTKHTLPLVEDDFRKVVSSVAKINMMHLIDTIRSQIDFNQMRAVNQHLGKLIAARKWKLPDMREIFTCGNIEKSNSSNSIVVESVDVDTEKKEEAAARKYMDKGAENTKDIDAMKIKDWIRFRVMLTKKDSQSPEATRKATVKILSILCALLGTDIPEERLRYAFETGGTNSNSTGKHEAFHVSIRYRYQCGGRVKTILVEIQIQKYMDSKDLADDHAEYVQKKDQKNSRIAGMNVTFYQFVMDLCDLVLSEYNPQTSAEFFDDPRRRPELEKMMYILLLILTKKGKDGALENSKVIRELYENEMEREKIREIARKCQEYVPFAHRVQPTERRPAGQTHINLLAKEVESILDEMEIRHSMKSHPGSRV